jgi:signal transduction histidine kinase
MTRPRVAWALAAVSVVFLVADVIVTASYQSLLSEKSVAIHGFPFVEGGVLGSAILGAVIVSRYDRHPIGWLLVMIGFVSSISLVTETYSFAQSEGSASGPDSVGHVAGWVSALTGGQVSIAGLAVMFLVAPDGQLLTRRWRYAVWLTVCGALLCVVGLFFMPPTEFDLDTDGYDISPVGGALMTGGFLLIIAGLIASLVSMVRRFALSKGVQRQQLRFVAAAVIVVALGVTLFAVVQLINGGHQTYAAAIPLFASYFCLPILLAIAVLRYRLYDIEVIINRAVVLAIATAFAGIGYVGVVVAVGRLVDAKTTGFWVSLVATALVALAFQPARRGIVRLANRLAYGPRAAPYVALAEFSGRLVNTPSPETLLAAVAEASGRAVSASRVSVRLDLADTVARQVDWPSAGPHEPDATEVEVRSDGASLGAITVSVPKGRRLRAADERLLRDLADQTALAFRNTAMETQLAQHVADLDHTTTLLEASRARVIEADDAARRALEAAIAREVLPHLVGLPSQLARIRQRGPSQESKAELDGLVAETNASLESLRELTRGLFPTQLSRAGVGPALRSHLARAGLDGMLVLDDDAAGRRFPARVEAAVYFCAVEAVRSSAQPRTIELTLDGDDLVLRVSGVSAPEVDLNAVLDRVEAAGGAAAANGDLTIRIPVGAAVS